MTSDLGHRPLRRFARRWLPGCLLLATALGCTPQAQVRSIDLSERRGAYLVGAGYRGGCQPPGHRGRHDELRAAGPGGRAGP